MKSPEISLSFGRLATAQCGATIVAATLWWLGASIGGFGMKIATAGAAQAGILLIISLIILALFSPSKKRPIATVSTLWSATSFIRFLVALGGSTLLYYSAQFGLRSLMFSFLLTAVFLLVAETKTLANSLSECSITTND
jgi:apolipoprotein N-acyltransferase